MSLAEKGETSTKRVPGAISQQALDALTINAGKMGRFSLDDDVLKRVFIPDLDSILSYFRKEPIDEQSLKIALKKARMPFVHVSDNNHGKERMRGFEDTTTGNQNLEQVQQAIVLLEANKISYEGHYEDIPAVPLEVNDVNYMIRVGKTTPMQFAPIPHRLSRLVVAKSLSFKDEQVEKEIKRESRNEDEFKIVIDNLRVLRLLFDFTPGRLDRIISR
ncbi:MAG TPA: hypothetical protein VKC89_02575 [Patescibacteria group bacterium]|nr:hypothetical protein [Patescibacteria group bacterium]